MINQLKFFWYRYILQKPHFDTLNFSEGEKVRWLNSDNEFEHGKVICKYNGKTIISKEKI